VKKSKVRYCRYCKKELDKAHKFFCNDECMNKFSEEYVSLEDIDRALEKLHTWAEGEGNLLVKDTVLDKCKDCKKDCKMLINKECLETIISFECFDFEKKS